MNVFDKHARRIAREDALMPKPIRDMLSPPSPSAPRPIVKSAGGKTRLLLDLHARMPSGPQRRYYEPFVGGGALFWSLAREGRAGGARLSDANDLLMNLYRIVQVQVEDLIELLSEMPHDRDYFEDIRTHQPTTQLERAAWYLYLNKTAFNGLMRFNRSGMFNTPFGKYDDPTICDAPLLRACSQVLREQRVELEAAPFESVLEHAKAGDLVYFDPPYLPISKTANFTAYTPGGFSFDDHVRLRDVALELKARGTHVMLSNSDHPRIRELYADGFTIDEVQASRSINSDGQKRGKVGELIIR